MTTAVVLGGGFAGVLAATVLARHAGRVVVVEDDHYPATPAPRRGLPQAHHSHVLVAGGAAALETLLPGTLAALYARGAHRRGLSGDTLILTAQGWYRRCETEAYLISCGRGLLDQVVRRRALDGGAVPVREGTRAVGLTGDASGVTGVRVRRGTTEETIPAGLVVDATGRRSQGPRWLAELGAAPPEEARVDSGLAYATRLYRAPARLAAAIPAVMLHPGPDGERPGAGATLFPIEDDHWIVTLTGTRGSEPPTDEPGFTRFARSLRDPIIADLMAEAEPAGPIRAYRDTANRRRFFERTPPLPGFLAIGDAVVAVNPVHSHGMSVAALSALRLDAELTRHGPAALPGLQAAMAEEAGRSWRMATENDGLRPERAERMTAFERAVRARITQAALTSPDLAAEIFRAHTLIPAAPGSPRALPGKPESPLTAERAITQYPGLSGWWNARRDSRELRLVGERHDL
ncbi:FAD-dependent monooxygenase [Spongiactinospora sp. TRM90649]|uniref:NAD(P)/FAD-dependent oxidoreductase n=1 Tax=Spongiactinospora sp. TRM90649 TaxID=3031114 RepID=UPI0023F6DE3C|nr:FAD-dependent monooxygenase [Spongiactinospora sp. TRM90649]MDF5759117.1 FAD-dependent monooxygenase [Spongiactinospora sp. TRM90649]